MSLILSLSKHGEADERLNANYVIKNMLKRCLLVRLNKFSCHFPLETSGNSAHSPIVRNIYEVEIFHFEPGRSQVCRASNGMTGHHAPVPVSRLVKSLVCYDLCLLLGQEKGDSALFRVPSL